MSGLDPGESLRLVPLIELRPLSYLDRILSDTMLTEIRDIKLKTKRCDCAGNANRMEILPITENEDMILSFPSSSQPDVANFSTLSNTLLSLNIDGRKTHNHHASNFNEKLCAAKIIGSPPMPRCGSETSFREGTPLYPRKILSNSLFRSIFKMNRLQDINNNSDTTLKENSSTNIKVPSNSDICTSITKNIEKRVCVSYSISDQSDESKMRVVNMNKEFTSNPFDPAFQHSPKSRDHFSGAIESFSTVKGNFTNRIEKSRILIGSSIDEMIKLSTVKKTLRRSYSADLETKRKARRKSAPAGKILETSYIEKKEKYTTLSVNGDLVQVQAKVNQYYLIKQIGSGSFGRVMLARDDETSIFYACKTISKNRLRKKLRWNSKKGHQKADEIMAEIKREVGILKQLPQHPNIVNLVEVLDDSMEDELYLCI